MRIVLFSWLVMLVVVTLCYAQQTVDVVYLKNGDIRKGTIVENVPDDHLRIETADGSIFTIKYEDIEKITKEIRPAPRMVQAAPQVKQGLMARNGDFGLSVVFWGGGTVSFEDYYHPEHEKETSVLIRIFYDSYLMEKFAAGLYFNISPVKLELFDEGATMFEIGGAFKPRFPLADGKAVIKMGLNIGYRFYSSDIDVVKKSQGLGINGSFEVQFDAGSYIVPFIEFGLLSQPVGGTHGETDITFGPIFYFGAGIAI
jgi:hypothetical protein